MTHDQRERNRAYQNIHSRKKNMLRHLKDSTSEIVMQNKLSQLPCTILSFLLTTKVQLFSRYILFERKYRLSLILSAVLVTVAESWR